MALTLICLVFMHLVDLYRQKVWFQLAMTEPLLLNITLAFTAALWQNVNPNIASKLRWEIAFRKKESIEAANALLQESQQGDVLLIAVAKLTHLAVSDQKSPPHTLEQYNLIHKNA